MSIFISNRQRAQKINSRLLEKIIAAFLSELKIENAELEINLVGVAKMTLLNETFLRHEGPTDVITFDYRNPEARNQKSEENLRGEIFICVDEAILQSKKFKTSWQSEILRYIVHGILHLQGFDDHRVAARRKMKREENRLLRKLPRRFALSKL